MLTSEHGGIGHRMSAVAMGIAAALEVDASIVLDDALSSMSRHQDRVSYPYLRRLFNLYSLPTTTEVGFDTAKPEAGMPAYDGGTGHLAYVPSRHVMEATVLARMGDASGTTRGAAGLVFILPTGHDRACLNDNQQLDYCVKAGMPGAYQAVRPLLASAFAAGEYGVRMPLPHYATTHQAGALVVAWYVRNDDIQLHAGQTSYWQTLVATVAHALQGMRADHYIISQRVIAEEDEAFGVLHRLEGWRWTGLHGLSVSDAIRYMAAADILVHSGSSFSLAAGLVAREGQIALFPMPKESTAAWDAPWRTYWLEGSIEVAQDGSLRDKEKAELHDRARTLSLHRTT